MIVELDGASPSVDPQAWVAPTATLVGDVRVAAGATIWYGAVLRADGAPITVGPRSNVQDNCVLHVDEGYPAVLGAGVTVGHGAVVHGCTVEDDVLVGMGAVVLNGARVGAGSLVAAGTVVLEGAQVPPRSLVAGVPGKVRRELGDDEVERIRANAQVYVARGPQYAAGARLLP